MQVCFCLTVQWFVREQLSDRIVEEPAQISRRPSTRGVSKAPPEADAASLEALKYNKSLARAATETVVCPVGEKTFELKTCVIVFTRPAGSGSASNSIGHQCFGARLFPSPSPPLPPPPPPPHSHLHTLTTTYTTTTSRPTTS